jgi:hypothetical protein
LTSEPEILARLRGRFGPGVPRSPAGRSAAVVERCQLDPAWFFSTILGAHPWPAQVAIAESVRDHRHTVVRSCNAAGKSYTAARIVCWWLFSFAPAIAVTTATTARQVRGILWKEIRLAAGRSKLPLGGRVLTQQWQIADDRFAIGFTAPEYDPERFSGWHSDHVLVVIDEASGVSREIQEACDALLSGGHARKLQIGNPVDPTSAFSDAFKQPEVSKLRVSAFETPNFTTFGITEGHILDGSWSRRIAEPLPYPTLVTPEWVADVYGRYGRDNPYCAARVRAEFPTYATNQLIPLEWIEAAMTRTLEPGSPIDVACDPARLGPDEAIIYTRRGPVLRESWSARSCTLTQVVGECIRALRVTGARTLKIDEDGLGSGVVDRCREILEHSAVTVLGLRGGLPPREPERYFNSRAEWYWGLRDRLEAGTIDLPPDDHRLAAQLAAIRIDPKDSRGRLKLESKDEMTRVRRLESPDRADAAAMAFAAEQQVGGTLGPVRLW